MQKTYFWISAGHEHVQWRARVSFHLHVSSPKLLKRMSKASGPWGLQYKPLNLFIVLCPTWNEVQKARCTLFGITSNLVKFWNSSLLLCALTSRAFPKHHSAVIEENHIQDRCSHGCYLNGNLHIVPDLLLTPESFLRIPKVREIPTFL
jgi:hypothetical protein